jgi:quinol monooxygenase YgiN
MLLHTAHLRVRADCVDAFKARLHAHAHATHAAEPGCMRFDVHQERGDPTLFLLVEWYDDQAALDVHRASPHYLAFREDTKDWIVDRRWWFWQAVAAPGREPGTP